MARQVGDNGKSKASRAARDVVVGAQVLELVAAGNTVTQAAKIAGVRREYASRVYVAEMQRHLESHNDLRREMLAQDLETLRLLIKAHMPAALGEVVELDRDNYVVTDSTTHVPTQALLVRVPDHQSAKIVLSALDRRAKLLGLDAAIRVEVSNAKVSEAVDDIEEMIDGATDDDLAVVIELDARNLPRSGTR